MMRILLFCCSLVATLISFPTAIKAQVQVESNSNAIELATALVDSGLNVSNAILTCGSNASGFFNASGTGLSIDTGIFIGTGFISGIIGPNNEVDYSTRIGVPGDPDLSAIVGQTTKDACILEFDVEPYGDTLRFDYVFGSDEYDEYVCSQFNDVFAFFVSGPNPAGGNYLKKNIALIPDTNIAVHINSVNNGSKGAAGSITNCTSLDFSQYYWSNPSNAPNLQYDGFTTLLGGFIPVIPFNTYHVSLKIADVGDELLDSGVFLKSHSLRSNPYIISARSHQPEAKYILEKCLGGELEISRPADLGQQKIALQYSGTAINGVDFDKLPDTITFLNNQEHMVLPIVPKDDSIPESEEILVISLVSPLSGKIIDSTFISFLDTLDLKVMPDTSICKGDQIDIWAKGAVDYHWYTTPTILYDSLNTTSIEPNNSTVYKVRGWIGNCTEIDSIKINVMPLPSVGISASSLEWCQNDTVFLEGTGATSYEWLPQQYYNAPSSATTFAIAIDSLNPILKGTSNNGCVAFDTLEFKINQRPEAEILIQRDTICPGDSLQLKASGSGSYLWESSNGVKWGNENTITVAPDKETTYSLTVIDSNECTNMDSSTINLWKNISPSFEYEVDSFTVNLTNQTPNVLSRTWHFGDGISDTSTNKTAIHSFDSSGIFKICLEVTYTNGCQDSTCSFISIITTGINNSSVADLIIYPNPTDGKVVLDYNGISSNATLSLYRIDGKQIFHEQLNQRSGKKILDIRHQPQGLYLLKIEDGKNATTFRIMRM